MSPTTINDLSLPLEHLIVSDMPTKIHGYLQGKMNEINFGAQSFHGNVTPVAGSNQIHIKIDTLPLEMSMNQYPCGCGYSIFLCLELDRVAGPVSRATLGYVGSPCWMMAHPNRGAVNGYKLTNGHMNQESEYRFQTGISHWHFPTPGIFL